MRRVHVCICPRQVLNGGAGVRIELRLEYDLRGPDLSLGTRKRRWLRQVVRMSSTDTPNRKTQSSNLVHRGFDRVGQMP